MKNTKLVIEMLLIMLSVMSLSATNNTLDFDGSNDFAATANALILSGLGNDLTFEVWIYIESFPAGDYDISSIMGIEDATNGTALLRLGDSGVSLAKNKLQFVLDFNGTQKKLNGTTELNANEWYHVTAAYKANQSNAYIYINGIEDANTHFGEESNFIANDKFYVGAIFDPASRFFDGKIDDVRVWNDVRSPAELRSNMYKELAGTESNLILNYNFNETIGTTADNSEGTIARDATLSNMDIADWETSSAIFGSKNGLQFTTDEYVSIASVYGLGNSSATIECWVNLPTTSEKGAFIHIGNNDVGYGIGVGSGSWDGSGNELIVLYDIQRWIPTGINIGTGWHHVLLTIDASGEPTIFLDGVNVYSDSGQLDALAPSGGSSIGSSQNAGRALSSGIIDEVRIWNDVRTETEIRENKCKKLVGNEAGLVAYYTFDNSGGTTLQDFTTSNNDGTLGNMDNTNWVTSTAFNTWLDTNSSTWATASNWSRGSSPVSTDNVGIYDYTSGTSPTLSGTPTLNNLIVGSSVDLSLSSNVTVNGNLFLYDDLDLNGQTITLGSSATLFESSGNISGTSGTIQTTRTLSYIEEDVAGLGAEITEDGNLGSTTIIRGHAAQGSNGINRYYQITPANNPTNATFVFNYLDAELNGVTEADLKLFKSADGNDWAVQSSSILNTTNNTVTLKEINSFSWWTAGDGDGPLPIELSSFTAIATSENYAQINWVTQSETDLSGYNIYRSNETNSENFLKINEELIAGNNNTTGASYEFIDVNVNPIATKYYWLESVDLDGTTEIFGPVSVNFSANYLVLGYSQISSENHFDVNLNWTLSYVSDDVIFYDVFRNTSFNFDNSVKLNSESIFIEDGYGLNYQFTDETTELGEDYCYWITANNYVDGLLVIFNPLNITMNHTEFSNFTTSTNSQSVKINWQTAFEIEMNSFQILKSATGSILDSEIVCNSDAENKLYESYYNFSDKEIFQGETYFYWIKGFASDRNEYLSEVQIVEIPFIDLLMGNYPNPFNPTTTIKFSVENPQNAKLLIFNLKGQKVRSFEITKKGEQEIEWNGKDEANKKVSSGVYFINLNTDNSNVVRKALLLK